MLVSKETCLCKGFSSSLFKTNCMKRWQNGLVVAKQRILFVRKVYLWLGLDNGRESVMSWHLPWPASSTSQCSCAGAWWSGPRPSYGRQQKRLSRSDRLRETRLMHENTRQLTILTVRVTPLRLTPCNFSFMTKHRVIW